MLKLIIASAEFAFPLYNEFNISVILLFKDESTQESGEGQE